MGDDQNSHRNAVMIFAVALIVVLVVAFVTTFRGVDTTRATNEVPPGTIGLAHSHPPLDRAPGEPFRN
jgi:predicted secreted protein